MIFEVRHQTSYTYGTPVSVSHHLLHLEPRSTANQRRLRGEIEVRPAPALRIADTDYFGNHTIFLTIDSQHRDLLVQAVSRIEVRPPPVVDPAGTPPWEQVAGRLAAAGAEAPLDVIEYSMPTARTPFLAECQAYARTSFPPGRPILEAALDLTHRIHEEFRYDSSATDTHTPLGRSFAIRRGVCQDFAHIEIACLRALGLAARYVSGYLLTHPPAGGERLTGADASHAWLGVWTGAVGGWVDLDPTNDLIPREQHVTLALGRDYGDVAPVAGVMFGGGRHRVSVAVDVIPVAG